MMKIVAVLALAFPALSGAQTSYMVKKGDTLLSIADQAIGNTNKNNPRRYQYVQRIRTMNPNIANPNALEPGQTLTLPATTAKPVVATKPTETATSAPPPTTTSTTLPPVQSESQVEPAPITQTSEATAEHHESRHSDFIFVQPRYQLISLNVKDLTLETKADMKSQSSYGLDLQYGKILNDHWHLLFQAGMTQTEFKDIESAAGTATVNHSKETTKSFAAGVAYEVTSDLHLDLMAMYADRTFLLPMGVGTYELKAVMIPGAELNISWDFYSGASNIFGISAIGEYVDGLEKDGVKYKSAFEPFGALYWKSKNGHDSLNYKVTLTSKHGHQKTDISEQTEDLSILGVGVYF